MKKTFILASALTLGQAGCESDTNTTIPQAEYSEETKVVYQCAHIFNERYKDFIFHVSDPDLDRKLQAQTEKAMKFQSTCIQYHKETGNYTEVKE